jgi:hypothetical protein
MDVVSHFVEILMGVVATLSLAIASMYRERIKASERDTDRLTKRVAELETKFSDQAKEHATQMAELRDRYETKAAEDGKARLQASEEAFQDQKELVMRWGAISEVLNRAQEGRYRR